MKSLLQHQPWRDVYRLQADEQDADPDVTAAVNEQLSLIQEYVTSHV